MSVDDPNETEATLKGLACRHILGPFRSVVIHDKLAQMHIAM